MVNRKIQPDPLARCLTKVIDDDQSNWDEKIDTVLMGYLASKQASTKHSPYYMLYQQEIRLPIDAEVNSNKAESDSIDPIKIDGKGSEETDVHSTITTLLDSRSKAFDTAKHNIKDAQIKQKEKYDRKHLHEELPVESLVLV